MWCDIWLWKWYLGGITGISWQGQSPLSLLKPNCTRK
jgi:hypothetical protein